MLLFEKFGQHQPPNRQAERYGREGVPLSVSTLADQVGAGCAALEPLLRRLECDVMLRMSPAKIHQNVIKSIVCVIESHRGRSTRNQFLPCR